MYISSFGLLYLSFKNIPINKLESPQPKFPYIRIGFLPIFLVSWPAINDVETKINPIIIAQIYVKI